MGWRPLTDAEIQQLERQLNSADDWNLVSVVDAFKADQVHRVHFAGRVQIGLDVQLANVGLLADCRLGDGCRIRNVSEISFTGFQFDFPLELRNEDGSRTVSACPEMTVADAYLASSVPEEHPLRSMASTASEYATMTSGYVGCGATVRNVKALRNVFVGESASLSECTLLENVMVRSTAQEPTCIGAGVVVRNAIFGLNNRVDQNTIVTNVVTGAHVALTDGLRISHSFVGDNSHLACCEVRHTLLFPFHAQHHNNSFLIASLLMGQSNMAAGATVGSNHNGRLNDCEFVAGRGFWPGLCVSLKFPSCFASYTLLAKGDYPYEIKLSLPFCLVNNNVQDDVLEIMPAYWWRHNAFALRRNAAKFKERDHRLTVEQYVHTNPLAPDTVSEILSALNRINLGEREMAKGIEHSRRNIRFLRFREGAAAYREMLLYYAVQTLEARFQADQEALLQEVRQSLPMVWRNVGGQLMREEDVEDLLRNPSPNWIAMHERYERLWTEYDRQNEQYACYVLKFLCDAKPTLEKLQILFDQGTEVRRDFETRADAERQRDKNSQFR